MYVILQLIAFCVVCYSSITNSTVRAGAGPVGSCGIYPTVSWLDGIKGDLNQPFV